MSARSSGPVAVREVLPPVEPQDEPKGSRDRAQTVIYGPMASAVVVGRRRQMPLPPRLNETRALSPADN